MYNDPLPWYTHGNHWGDLQKVYKAFCCFLLDGQARDQVVGRDRAWI